MTDWRTVDLRPAPPGWRVWTVSPSGASSNVLVGWVVQEEAVYDDYSGEYVASDTDPDFRRRRVVEAIYQDAPCYLVDCGEDYPHRWLVLGPGEPDPTAEEQAIRLAEVVADETRRLEEFQEKVKKSAAEQFREKANKSADPVAS